MSGREIKFRAWNKVSKRMIGFHDVIFEDLGADGLLNDSTRLCETSIRNINDSWMDFMQYTGLKDKNGVEIYEGDIVQGEMMSGRKSNREVKFCPVTFGFKFFKDQQSWSMMHCSDCVEVVGNIHQNPELIKGGE